MSKYDKSLTAKAFCIPGNENNQSTIFIATNTYGIGIDNPNIELMI